MSKNSHIIPNRRMNMETCSYLVYTRVEMLFQDISIKSPDVK